MLAADSDCSNEKDNTLHNIPIVARSSTSLSQPVPVSSRPSQHQVAVNLPKTKTKKSKATVINGTTLQPQTTKEIINSKSKIETCEQDQSISADGNTTPDKENSNLPSSISTDLTLAKRKSSSAQTRLEDFQEATGSSKLNEQDIAIPLSLITLQSILASARAKADTEISPKQFGVYQLCKDIILLFQESLQSERDAYDFIGRPIKDVVGHPIDCMAWWFWIIQKSVEDLKPPPGYILPALKMLRQEITSLADGAVEIINVQKTIHKQLRRMARILNNVFVRYEDIFGVREWEHRLRKNRSEDAGTVHDKYEKWLRTTMAPPPDCVKLTCFKTKSLLLQHNTNEDYPPISINKIDLKKQKEFIKSCLHHMNSLVRQSCMDSLKANEDLNKAEKEIQENIDKLVKKIENLRRFHRFRQTTCAILLKKSLSNLGFCLYEFIDMVIFIRKLGRFVLLASQHVLRYANSWSHLCDVTCISQLDSVLTEFSEGEAFAWLQCFEKWSGKEHKNRKREKVMAAFEEYFHYYNSLNISTVQVQLPMSVETSNIIFGKDDKESTKKAGTVCKKSESIMAGKKKTNISIPDIYSTKEVDITFIAKGTRPIPAPIESHTDIDTAQKLEEIGIRLNNKSISGECNKGCTLKAKNPSESKSLCVTVAEAKNNTSKGKLSKLSSDQEHIPKMSMSLEKFPTSNLESA